jgi:hypothetical protein
MTATDKRSLISDSVMVTQINIHHAGEEADQHAVRTTLEVSHTTTICEIPTNSKVDPCSQDKVMAPSNVRPGCHPGLPHSPSKTTSKEGGVIQQSSYRAIRLIGPHKTLYAVSTIQSLP